ncbi:MAG: deoxyribodipyrimidine photo-lyase [Flammeovirgaceae bacterium]|nr:MAG: deoxyribodipyrimidine photo-lyase [Flammeovirgaceae bacterium]
MNKTVTLFWFRRDLRLQDNAGLYHALKENNNVLPIFIFDTEILDKLEDEKDARVEFIHQSLNHLKKELEDLGGSLAVFHGNPVKIFNNLNPKAVYTNHDYEPYGKQRDAQIKKILEAKGVRFKSFKDIVIFEKDEIIKDDGTPYTVYTPYSKKWKATLNNFYSKSYPVEKYTGNLLTISPLPFPELPAIGFKKSGITFPERKIKLSVIEKYHLQRDIPGIEGTSRLSVHLRFGTVSIRKLVQVALKKNEKWLNELIWRDFYHMILWHFPHVAIKAFKPAYDQIEWRNNPEEFRAWCEGKTGYPIVDAGMRELNATGYMHNRVRMIVASFLTKHLLIDWRWGEAYFAKKLLDFDLAANNGGWQWAAGSGCDAAPYFRVFNPYIQTEKFDPDRKYIKKWVPEVDTPDYPKPIVDHAIARERVLKAYQVALR